MVLLYSAATWRKRLIHDRFCFKNAPPATPEMADHRCVNICTTFLLPVEQLEVTKFQTQFAVALMIRFYP